MTPSEYATKIREQQRLLMTDNRPLKIAASTVHKDMGVRIFQDGKDVNNASIGNYSSDDIWVNPVKTATKNKKGFSPLKGKGGNTEFKTNPSRKRVTSYFEGWKGLREAQGLGTDKVNLNFTGDMFFDFTRPLLMLHPDEYVSRFSRAVNADKAEGNEAHFGKTIFKLSQDERTKFFATASRELKLLLAQ